MFYFIVFFFFNFRDLKEYHFAQSSFKVKTILKKKPKKIIELVTSAITIIFFFFKVVD